MLVLEDKVTWRVDRLTSRRVNKLRVLEDRVTDEQVRGVTGRVDRLTSRRVNRLLGIEDKVTDEQVRGVTWRVDKLTSRRVNKLTVDGLTGCV